MRIIAVRQYIDVSAAKTKPAACTSACSTDGQRCTRPWATSEGTACELPGGPPAMMKAPQWRLRVSHQVLSDQNIAPKIESYSGDEIISVGFVEVLKGI